MDQPLDKRGGGEKLRVPFPAGKIVEKLRTRNKHGNNGNRRILGASPPAAGTGLSACIFFACGKKGYRFYPLREPKPLRGFGFAEFGAKPQTPGSWEFMLRINSENQKPVRVFGSPSVAILSCKFFAKQKTYETIVAGILPACGFGFPLRGS
jgi:hypothetical protein